MTGPTLLTGHVSLYSLFGDAPFAFFTGKSYRCFLRIVFACQFLLATFSLGSFSRFFSRFIFFKCRTMSTEPKPPPDPTIGAPTLHKPSFMPFDPLMWFTLVELGFKNYKISSDVSRFSWFTGHLFPDITLQVRDITVYSLSYDALKVASASRLAPPEDQSVRRLLQRVELGNKMLSELLW